MCHDQDPDSTQVYSNSSDDDQDPDSTQVYSNSSDDDQDPDSTPVYSDTPDEEEDFPTVPLHDEHWTSDIVPERLFAYMKMDYQIMYANTHALIGAMTLSHTSIA